MNSSDPPDNPYLLLTPGPLTTTSTVKHAMLRDLSTWDRDYNSIVQEVRSRLVEMASGSSDKYTSVLMQGSGTFSVESLVGSALPRDGKLLVPSNGAYGNRIVTIARTLGVPVTVHYSGELSPPDLGRLDRALEEDPGITHVMAVHNETTTGMMNPVREIGEVVARHGRIFMVDAMSSFGGVEMDMDDLGARFLVSSANKCIQGVPGFGFILARRDEMEKCAGRARSHSLDMHDQWDTMEKQGGKWRFTSPTHTLLAFRQALYELDAEGGVAARQKRYTDNYRTMVGGMRSLGFSTVLSDELHSPIITMFYYPGAPKFDFFTFYDRVKERGFVMYPGKVTDLETFRIGCIGDIYPRDMERLVVAVKESIFW